MSYEKCQELVLITGGSGLVGKALAEVVAEQASRLDRLFRFAFISSKDADLTDLETIRSLFEELQPNYVINLAAKVGGLYANLADKDDLFYRINMAINKNVLECSSELRVRKCISCLSTCIFPHSVEYPLDETKIHLGPPHSSNVGYSLAKRQVDLLNRQLNAQVDSDSQFTAIIPTNIYGCHDNFSLENSHVIPGLIHKAYLSAMKAISSNSIEASLLVCGSGKPLRQFIYSIDLAKLILWALENYTDREPLIMSPDESDEVSIGCIANIISEAYSQKFNINMRVDYDSKQNDGQYKKTSSNRKLRGLNAEFKFTPLRAGIREVIDWFCNNYPNVRK